jgi:hypothetical protein
MSYGYLTSAPTPARRNSKPLIAGLAVLGFAVVMISGALIVTGGGLMPGNGSGNVHPSATPQSQSQSRAVQWCSKANQVLAMRSHVDEIASGMAAANRGLILTGAMGLPQEGEVLPKADSDPGVAALMRSYAQARLQLLTLGREVQAWYYEKADDSTQLQQLNKILDDIREVRTSLDDLQNQANLVGCIALLPSAPASS